MMLLRSGWLLMLLLPTMVLAQPPDLPAQQQATQSQSKQNHSKQSHSKQVTDAKRATVAPLPRAHAHNDYHHDRPLLDALDRGFCSVEADIYLVGGQLLVAHSPLEWSPKRTLQKLYLDPLKARIAKQGGRVYRDGPTFTLLVDIKFNGRQVYQRLRQVLAGYKQMLCRIENGRWIPGAVQIVISGDRPKREILADATRMVGIDGRISDLNSEQPPHALPLISDRWSSHFRWRGKGPFPPQERAKLKTIVDTAHATGRRVRFWATPELPAVWNELLKVQVDHINTDKLAELQRFLKDAGNSTSEGVVR